MHLLLPVSERVIELGEGVECADVAGLAKLAKKIVPLAAQVFEVVDMALDVVTLPDCCILKQLIVVPELLFKLLVGGDGLNLQLLEWLLGCRIFRCLCGGRLRPG